MERRLLLFLSCFCVFTSASFLNEQFDEKLAIRPLPDGRVAATFVFTTILKDVHPRDPRTLQFNDESQHYTLFPLSLGQILREYAVSEMHLTLNAGNWNYDRWGYPDEPGVANGAELWAWMGVNQKSMEDEQWRGLRNALAGLFCATLGSLDDQRTTSPILSFQPHDSLPSFPSQNQSTSASSSSSFHALRHASLPSEHVCTENLTPFLKLLPCKSRSGLASLLNPHKLFDADWHGMGVHVSWISDEGVKLRLTFQTIMDPLRITQSNKRSWSLENLFGKGISQRCPVAHTSQIVVSLPRGDMYAIRPEPPRIHEGAAIYDLNQASINNLRQTSPLPLSIDRTLKGTNQANGYLSLVLTNRLPNDSLKILYLEAMPWYLQLYLHTLQSEVSPIDTSLSSDTQKEAKNDLFKLINYIPSIQHSRPTMLQALLTLPPNCTVTFKMHVVKSFLRYTEYPPDAQRGWDLPPGVLTLLDDVDGKGNKIEIGAKTNRIFYTRPLLVDLATPDFSMPYNVIIFTCSVIAFLFGSVFNLLTRPFVVVRVGKEKKEGDKEKQE
ncbi:hypothetical protein AMATHDRAFT_137876 [Amanita thiersii Skay4041]|uniref:GPI transamidase component PIG-T n=1 Tax=Amanita thiersii Skay4041 TaxID=703135 RepID=A0A2A9NQP3_9AGAR|nr:hypothetical protein AMATHDRAFT_137876 [Amanita thiersii Skay4041]